VSTHPDDLPEAVRRELRAEAIEDHVREAREPRPVGPLDGVRTQPLPSFADAAKTTTGLSFSEGDRVHVTTTGQRGEVIGHQLYEGFGGWWWIVRIDETGEEREVRGQHLELIPPSTIGLLPPRDPAPEDPDFGCGPRYHELGFTDFAREHLEDPGDVFELAAENGMGC